MTNSLYSTFVRYEFVDMSTNLIDIYSGFIENIESGLKPLRNIGLIENKENILVIVCNWCLVLFAKNKVNKTT